MNEYIYNMLKEEMRPPHIVRSASLSGNDIYGQIHDIRVETINKFQERLYALNEELAITTDPERLELIAKLITSTEKYLSKISPFGYDFINYDNRYPLLKENHENLANRFYVKYYNYRIAYNTLEAFSAQLGNIFEDIAPAYENKLRMIKMYDNVLKDNISLDDINVSESENISSFFNEQNPEISHKSDKNDSRTLSKSSDLATKIKNISAGNTIYQNVLKDYLNEYNRLFICIWGDESEGII